jgi:hypothetical protein
VSERNDQRKRWLPSCASSPKADCRGGRGTGLQMGSPDRRAQLASHIVKERWFIIVNGIIRVEPDRCDEWYMSLLIYIYSESRTSTIVSECRAWHTNDPSRTRKRVCPVGDANVLIWEGHTANGDDFARHWAASSRTVLICNVHTFSWIEIRHGGRLGHIVVSPRGQGRSSRNARVQIAEHKSGRES